MIKDSLIESDRAYGLVLTNRNDEAFKYINTELRVNPTNINAINAYGINLNKIEKPQLAIKFFELVLKMISNDHTARYNLARAYEFSKDAEKAISAYTYLINKYPQSGINYYCRARVQSDNKMNKEAIADYKNTIRLGDLNDYGADSALVYYWVAKCYDKLTDNPNAILYYTLSYDYDNSLINALARRGNLYYKINDFDKALLDFNKLIEVSGDKVNYKIYNMRAYIFTINNDLSFALKDLNKSIELNSKGYSTYNQRGLVYIQLSQVDKACKDFNTALELGYKKSDKLDKYCNN